MSSNQFWKSTTFWVRLCLSTIQRVHRLILATVRSSRLTCGSQRHPDLVPCWQKDFYALFIPGREGSCRMKTCNVCNEQSLFIEKWHILAWLLEHICAEMGKSTISKLPEIIYQLIYHNSIMNAPHWPDGKWSLKCVIWAVPALWLCRNSPMVVCLSVRSVTFWNFFTKSLWRAKMSGRNLTSRSSAS